MDWNMIRELAIICPLVFLGGFVDAIAGGGGLISLPAYLLAGLPVHLAIGTNKLSACLGTLIATARYAKSGFIPWRLASFCVVCSLLGAQLGAHVALMLSDYAFKVLMLALLPPTALYVIKGKALIQAKEPLGPARTTLLSMLVAFVCGTYDGFYGPGAGTFMLLGLTVLAHLNLTEANGTTKAINLTSNITALVVFVMNGRVLIPIGLVAAAFGIAGSYMGARSFERGGARVVKPIMLTVLAVFFVRVLWEVVLGG